MEHARKQQLPKETITSSDTTVVEEFDQKTTFQPLRRKMFMDEGVCEKLKKKKNQYEAEKRKAFRWITEGLKDKGQAKSCKKIKLFEPISVHDSDNAEHDDAKLDNTDMPVDQGEDLGNTNEQPNDEVVPKNDWYNVGN
ncbi:hypothetical protein Tco_1080139 [Tanacetum coccineum]|uniref:Uncharacterized protein n=1 Tax=Tanacetum coccineum TaxID=301880 RepID=A0ABQ5HUR3_9ASTR